MSNIKRCKACDGTGYFMTEEELSSPDTILFPVGGPADECKVCDGTGYVDVVAGPSVVSSTSRGVGDWPPDFEPMKLQARPPQGGDWTDIFPAQLRMMAKNGCDVRAIEPTTVTSKNRA